MKKIMLIGPSRAGKTTLIQRLSGRGEESVLKTQTLSFYSQGVDSPGEYLENRQYYGALITASMESDVVGFVQDSTVVKTIYPPGFSSMFTKPVIGIVTKIDSEDNYSEDAAKTLRLAGASKIFFVSAISDLGVDSLIEFLTAS
jgi:ethanolamine utilization protein EutP